MNTSSLSNPQHHKPSASSDLALRMSQKSSNLKDTSAIEPSELGQLTELQASLKELLEV